MKKKAAAPNKRVTTATPTKKTPTKKASTKKAATKKKVAASKTRRPAAAKGKAKRPSAKRASPIVKASKAGTKIRFLNPVYTIIYGSQLVVTAEIRRTINDLPVKQVPLTLKVTNRDYGSANSDNFGYARWTVRTNLVLNPAQHTVLARFGGNGDFSSSTGTATLKVSIAGSKLRAETTPKPGGRFELRAILNGQCGEPAVDRRVKFLVNGSQKGTAKTDGAGIARYEHRPGAPGNKLTVEFDGDSFYKASKATTTF